MFYKNIGKFMFIYRYAIVFLLATLLFSNDAYALFDSLKEAGTSIFKGLRGVIYPAATIGVACVCIGGMFGNFNWKWLVAIVLGIFVITCAVQIGQFTADGASLEGLD